MTAVAKRTAPNWRAAQYSRVRAAAASCSALSRRIGMTMAAGLSEPGFADRLIGFIGEGVDVRIRHANRQSACPHGGDVADVPRAPFVLVRGHAGCRLGLRQFRRSLPKVAAAYGACDTRLGVHMSLGLILLIVLVLLLIGAFPAWGYSRGWGYAPTGGIGLILIIVLVLLAMGREAVIQVKSSSTKEMSWTPKALRAESSPPIGSKERPSITLPATSWARSTI